jgi:hypothetical protein
MGFPSDHRAASHGISRGSPPDFLWSTAVWATGSAGLGHFAHAQSQAATP